MRYDVSMVKRGDWRIGIVFGAEYATTVRSKGENEAILAAQVKRRKEQSIRFKGEGANIDLSWQYCLPDELVPIGQAVAKAMGTAFYVGGPCNKHPLNNVRYTCNRCCAICDAQRQKGMKQ